MELTDIAKIGHSISCGFADGIDYSQSRFATLGSEALETTRRQCHHDVV